MHLLKKTVLSAILVITNSAHCTLPCLEDHHSSEKAAKHDVDSNDETQSSIKKPLGRAIWGLRLGSMPSYYSWQKEWACIRAARNSNISETVKKRLCATIAPTIVGGLAYEATTPETSGEYELFITTLLSSFAFTSGFITGKTCHHSKTN